MSDEVRMDLKEMLNDAFVAGFMASSEGYNAEYPFNFDDDRIRRETAEAFKEEFETIVTMVRMVSTRRATQEGEG